MSVHSIVPVKALIQRVTKGKVVVEGSTVGEIGRGYVILLGVKNGDTEENARYLAHKTVGLRVFQDQQDKMNLSIQDIGGQVLVVSQFTLYADTRKGNRPSFVAAAPPDAANALYEIYVDTLRRALGPERVATGAFRASMTVELTNDGPVTVELSTDVN